MFILHFPKYQLSIYSAADYDLNVVALEKFDMHFKRKWNVLFKCHEEAIQRNRLNNTRKPKTNYQMKTTSLKL